MCMGAIQLEDTLLNTIFLVSFSFLSLHVYFYHVLILLPFRCRE